MNVIVHLMFSYRMRKIIKEESGITLNLFGFMFGNILPDLSTRFDSQPHNMNGSLNFIIKRTGGLLSHSKTKVARNSYQYSKNLGVITHYLSDFFCYPHQKHYNKGLKDHGIYEMIMIAKYRKGIKNYRQNFAHHYHSLAPNDFKKWIHEKNVIYNNQEVTCMNDISHALYASSMISRSILLHQNDEVTEALCDPYNIALQKCPT